MSKRKLFHHSIYPVLIPVLFFIGCNKADLIQENVEPKNMSGEYLGQTPPGMTPTLFCPEVFTVEVHSTAMFSPDGKEVYWKLMGGRQIFFMKMENNTWSAPKKVDFALFWGTGDPALSPDGKTLYFTSFKSIKGMWTSKKESIWFVKRAGNGWSDPEPLNLKVNKYDLHWQHSVAANGNLYFSAENALYNKDIYMAEFVDDGYADPVNLGNSVNGNNSEGCPYISPDEGYMIFDRHGGTIGHADLYISFRNQDGSWGEAKNMGQRINSAGKNETCPFVTFDQKYFFFIRNDENGALRIYWVDAKIIEELKPINLK